jgi:hypothetical protein
VTGLGTDYGSSAARIAPQFLKYLVAIHDFDWRAANLPSFTVPSAHPKQAALWQADWYLRIWEQDATDQLPLASLMRRWLRESAPECADLCLVHADYRMGNFMFDEKSGEMTAVLDWELAHIGDFHEDVAYVTQKLFGLVNDAGEFLCCGLFPREEFLGRYQELSGRTIDPAEAALLRGSQCVEIGGAHLRDLRACSEGSQQSPGHSAELAGVGGPRLRRRDRRLSEREENHMMPSIDLRLQTMAKAMADVILPAIAPENLLAREQAQLLIAHLGMISKHRRDAAKYEALELREIAALAERLCAVATAGAETRAAADALATLLRERKGYSAGGVDEDRTTIATAIDVSIRASGVDGDEVFKEASSRAILEYSALEAWRGRVWFAGCGMDPERARLPEIDDMLAKATKGARRERGIL